MLLTTQLKELNVRGFYPLLGIVLISGSPMLIRLPSFITDMPMKRFMPSIVTIEARQSIYHDLLNVLMAHDLAFPDMFRALSFFSLKVPLNVTRGRCR